MPQIWPRSGKKGPAIRTGTVLKAPCFDAWFKTFAPGGHAPAAGDLIRLPDHADTLEAIAESDAAAFYTGEIARRIDAESRKYGGYLRYEDLAAYQRSGLHRQALTTGDIRSVKSRQMGRESPP